MRCSFDLLLPYHAGEGLETVELSLEDLKTKFKKTVLTVTIQCAGRCPTHT